MTQMELTFEAWKPVAGYEGRYDVSDQGRVWSRLTDRILRPGPNSQGYLTVTLLNGGRHTKKTCCVHHLVMAAFVGPLPAGYHVDHGRHGKQCNALANLEYVTPLENDRRSRANGLWKPRGKNKVKRSA